MSTELDAALARVDARHGIRVMSDESLCALAAAVRGLRGAEDEGLRVRDHLRSVTGKAERECEKHKARADRAEAALAELRGRTCDACRFHWFNYGDLCKLHDGQCNHFGFTCGAYAAKEPSNG